MLSFRLGPKLWGLAILFLASVVAGSSLAELGGTSTGIKTTPKGGQPPVKQLARKDIPPDYLRLYRKAGEKYEIPWTVLAGIGRVESNHGRSRLPGVRSGSNRAGACGPMQIGCVPGSKAGNSWARYGRGDVHDPRAAIPGAARYLVGHGAHKNLYGAIYGYNHADWYVREVLSWSKKYRTGGLS